MGLPDDILVIIRVFSKPITRPDWRSIKRICMGSLYKEIIQTKNDGFSLREERLRGKFIRSIQNNQPFSTLRDHVFMYGIKSCSEKYGIQESVLVHLPFPNLQTILRNYVDKYGIPNCIQKYGIQKNTLIQLLNN